MVEEVEQALRVEDADKRLHDLNAEIAALPKRVAAIERQLEAHLRKLEADRAALSANHKERKQRELDVLTHQQKISKLRDQTLQAKTNEQYRAFQHEIEFCETEIRKAEDRTLDLMSEAEPLEAAVKAAEVALAEERKLVDAEKKSALERTAVDKKQLEELTAQRQTLFAAMSPRLRQTYERLRKKHPGGPIVADATDGRCHACQMVLRPQYFQQLKRATEAMFCESCGRILRYAPAVDQEAMYEGGTRVALS